MMAASPELQKLPLWRILHPVPIAPTPAGGRDPRIDFAEAMSMHMRDNHPDFYAGHPMNPFDPDEEEWLLVVEGSVVLRAPDGERALSRGDLVCFPPGPSGAHQISNRSESPARTLLFSRTVVPAVSVYPDSRKLGVWLGDEHHMVRAEQTLDYWDGEA